MCCGNPSSYLSRHQSRYLVVSRKGLRGGIAVFKNVSSDAYLCFLVDLSKLTGNLQSSLSTYWE